MITLYDIVKAMQCAAESYVQEWEQCIHDLVREIEKDVENEIAAALHELTPWKTRTIKYNHLYK